MPKTQNNSKNFLFVIIIIPITLLFIFLIYYFYINNSKENKISDHIPSISTSAHQATETSSLPSLSDSIIKYVNSFKLPTTTSISSINHDQNITINHDINDYRNYLINVNLLIYNFLQNKNYNKQLRIITKVPLPKEIQNTLADLNNYNNLIDKADDMEMIFPTNYPIIQKLIKIERKTPSAIEKEKYRINIIMKLEYLIYFFYSEKFAQEFIK